MTITAAIITNKLELNSLLLQSLSFVDEIIIVFDSSPATHDHPRHSGLRPGIHPQIFHRPLNRDFAAQRNFALQKAKSDWVLFVDDDEYVGTELAREIKEAIKDSLFNGYLIKRQDVVYHQPLLHGETGNIKILRLGRRATGKFYRPVHEVWQIKGRVGELTSPLYHIKDHFVSEFSARMSQYGQVDAKILTGEGKPFTWFRLLANPLAKFQLNYLIRAGFLDGIFGLFLAYLMAVQSLSVRVFQWQNLK